MRVSFNSTSMLIPPLNVPIGLADATRLKDYLGKLLVYKVPKLVLNKLTNTFTHCHCRKGIPIANIVSTLVIVL